MKLKEKQAIFEKLAKARDEISEAMQSLGLEIAEELEQENERLCELQEQNNKIRDIIKL